ncbi:Hym1p [Malassezia sp. CBS 17886]|nr:Hym1p [Malassezia sp. CBS 17886]
MNFLFKARPRLPSELVRALRDAAVRLGVLRCAKGALQLGDAPVSSDARRKTAEEMLQLIQHAKLVLYGEGGSDPVPEQVAQFAQEAYQLDLLQYLLVVLPRLEFETRKDVVQLFSALLQRRIGSRLPTVEYLSAHPTIVLQTFQGYDDQDIALNTGMMLHEMLQHERLAKVLLYADDFYRFPHFIETSSFGVSCDVFSNLRDTLMRHKPMAADYLADHFTRFFAMHAQLLDSANYVTKRQSIKLLGEILVDRAFYAVMTRYVSDDANLKRVMNLLRERSKNIQFEAFHVFKVFVANPKKTPAVEAILRRNRERLLAFLSDFLLDRTDESLTDERQYVMQIISALPPLPGSAR